MCSLGLVELLDTPSVKFAVLGHIAVLGHMDAILAIFRIAIIETIVVTGIHLFFSTIATIAVIRSQLYLFQNCHNCDNCDGKRSIYFFVFRIAIIATIDVTRIFQNCHNCDNCGHRVSYISELHESLLLCQRDVILAIFRIAIIATIVVTGIHLCFFHNCHNCNNCCHQESTVPFSELP